MTALSCHESIEEIEMVSRYAPRAVGIYFPMLLDFQPPNSGIGIKSQRWG